MILMPIDGGHTMTKPDADDGWKVHYTPLDGRLPRREREPVVGGEEPARRRAIEMSIEHGGATVFHGGKPIAVYVKGEVYRGGSAGTMST
jgi:hypothetical protein